MDYVVILIAQCGEPGGTEFNKLQLFPLFFTRAIFEWYTNLLSYSVTPEHIRSQPICGEAED